MLSWQQSAPFVRTFSCPPPQFVEVRECGHVEYGVRLHCPLLNRLRVDVILNLCTCCGDDNTYHVKEAYCDSLRFSHSFLPFVI